MIPENSKTNFGEAAALYVAFVICMFGAKIAAVALWGNGTPYWDQWDAEGDLFRRWLEGSLEWSQLFSTHNEHRIFLSRLLAIGVFELGGRIWNPILQMQANAALHVAGASALLFYLTRSLSASDRAITILCGMVIFSVPYGWENTLAGFQSPFYFLLLLSVIFLRAMSVYKTYSKGWWWGLAAGFLCPLTLASGAITLFAGAVTLIFRRLGTEGRTQVSISAIVLLMLAAAVSIGTTPTIPAHTALKAQSVGQFLSAFVKVFSWPSNAFWISAFIVQTPLLVLVYRTVLNKSQPTPTEVFILSMAVWLLGQFVSLSYGRAVAPAQSRYLDLFAVGLLINLVSAFVLLRAAGPRRVFAHQCATAIWLLTIALGFWLSADGLLNDIRRKADQSREQERNVRAYLCTGDNAHLTNKADQEIPYPDMVRLKALLDTTAIRQILPGNIYEPNSKRKLGKDGEPFCDPGKLTRVFEQSPWGAAGAKAATVGVSSIVTNEWKGTDYFRSALPGFRVIGSFVNSENDTGLTTLRLRRGDRLLFRSGPRVAGQYLLINGGGSGKFYTSLPLALEWSVLEFSNPELPEEFSVTFIDAGTRWGEWSAIALQLPVAK